jgi:hypothetical protein
VSHSERGASSACSGTMRRVQRSVRGLGGGTRVAAVDRAKGRVLYFDSGAAGRSTGVMWEVPEVAKHVWIPALALAWAIAVHSPAPLFAAEETTSPRPPGKPIELRYVWEEGSVARVRTKVEGIGVVRESGVEQRMRMSAEIVSREEVDRAGPSGDATLITVWESAAFNINGETASFAPETATVEKRVGESGEVYWAKERGRDRAARQGEGTFAVDTRQLALLDMLVEQVQYLRLPRQPVVLGEEWRSMDRVETTDVRGWMQKTSEIEAVGEGADKGTCSIRTSITAPLEFALEQEDLLFRGKVTGNIAHDFDSARGRLNSATGSLAIELRATWPGGPPPETPLETAEPPRAEAPSINADDSAPFLVNIQFQVRVEREHGVVAKAN